MWGATCSCNPYRPCLLISIHAPRVGSDSEARRAGAHGKNFNPRSPCGERQRGRVGVLVRREISIHAPRVGSDPQAAAAKPPERKEISIHAPRVGSDPPGRTVRESALHFNPRSPCGERLRRKWKPATYDPFQSTLPVWGATTPPRPQRQSLQFQSTLPVWGATAPMSSPGDLAKNFNPRSPCGERQLCTKMGVTAHRFQSTLPVWGATDVLRDHIQRCEISIHAPRVGSDPCGAAQERDGARFQSTLPVWGATRRA